MTDSLSFGRAVSYYDQTRALPEWVQSLVTDSLVRASSASMASRFLEIGIGTGRIALPLLERGHAVIGMDLSLGMLGALKAKLSIPVHVALAQADAVALPFPEQSFDSVYAVQVMHLVSGWRQALSEAYRVLKPGGKLLLSYYSRDPSWPDQAFRTKLNSLVAEFGVNPRRPGAGSLEGMRAELSTCGETSIVEVAHWSLTTSLSRILEGIAAQIYSDTWLIPTGILQQVLPTLRAWAKEQYGDLDRAIQQEDKFCWMITAK